MAGVTRPVTCSAGSGGSSPGAAPAGPRGLPAGPRPPRRGRRWARAGTGSGGAQHRPHCLPGETPRQTMTRTDEDTCANSATSHGARYRVPAGWAVGGKGARTAAAIWAPAAAARPGRNTERAVGEPAPVQGGEQEVPLRSRVKIRPVRFRRARLGRPDDQHRGPPRPSPDRPPQYRSPWEGTSADDRDLLPPAHQRGQARQTDWRR